MPHRCVSLAVLLLGTLAVVLASIAQQGPTEAPTGFDTATLAQSAGSQSVSNGIAQPAGDTYALDQSKFERDHDASTGLGPVFNARACVDCHQNPVSGGSSQFTEIRAGHNDANGNFVAATVPINDGANIIANRSIINDRALIPQAQECVGSHSTRWVVPLLCAFLRSALSRGALPPEPPGIYFPARMQGAVR